MQTYFSIYSFYMYELLFALKKGCCNDGIVNRRSMAKRGRKECKVNGWKAS